MFRHSFRIEKHLLVSFRSIKMPNISLPHQSLIVMILEAYDADAVDALAGGGLVRYYCYWLWFRCWNDEVY
jgi:hypothetical protein